MSRSRLAVVLLAALLAALGSAREAAAVGEAFSQRTLTIHAVPEVEGLRFEFAGVIYTTDANGFAHLPHAAVIAKHPPRPLNGSIGKGVRVRFSRYFGKPHSGEITATYNIYYRVSFSFIDTKGHPVPVSRIQAFGFKNAIGLRRTVKPHGALWLQGARVVAESASGLRTKRILYRVEEVKVHGTNVVNRSQQDFKPAERRQVYVQLLFYTARLSVRDAFFGLATGSKVKLTFPDGTVRRYPVGPGGTVTATGLPRGNYDVTVQGGGLPIARPLALSSDTALQVEVLTYLDIGLVVGFLLLFVVGLPLIRRGHLVRRGLAAVGVGRRGRRRRETVAPETVSQVDDGAPDREQAGRSVRNAARSGKSARTDPNGGPRTREAKAGALGTKRGEKPS